MLAAVAAAVAVTACGRNSPLVAHDGGVVPDAAADARVPSGADGASSDGRAPDGGGPRVDGPPAGPEDAATTDAGGGGDGGTPPPPPPLTCPSPIPPRTPLRRLNRFQYNNTVRDLFGNDRRPADALPWDDGPPEDGELATPTLLVEGYRELAHEQALEATRDAAAVNATAGCDAARDGEAGCRQRLFDGLLPRLLRRPLAAEDVADFEAVFATGRQLGGDLGSGVRAVVEVALQSPEFLYRIELGEPAGVSAPALGRPRPYEMAARLSYLLWGAPPDSALYDAAARGGLRDRTDIEAQARRMLTDPRAHDVVRYFYFQRLRLLEGDLIDVPRPNPAFTQGVAALMLEETGRFIDEVTWTDPGDLQALLTAPVSWMNGSLARFYGVPNVAGDAFQRVELDPARRGGLLTQGSFLARHSHSDSSNPVMRGITVATQFLCLELAPEPPDVDVPPPVPLPPNATTRERYARHSSEPRCATCHRDFDPIGFAFEHYDSSGAWRDTENGSPIDATGEIFMTDARGRFDGALDLSRRLAASQDVHRCMAGNWLTFALGRRLTADDACSRQSVVDAFLRARGNVRELLVALTQTDAFLYRPADGP